MSLFSSSFTPKTPVVSGPSSSTSTLTKQQDMKRKRPRESSSTATTIAQAYDKRTSIITAQSNLEKLMKKVGMTNGSGSNSNLDSLSSSTSKSPLKSKDNPHLSSSSTTDSEPVPPSKKPKLKHGLDGRPTNSNGGVSRGMRGDPLAGLSVGKSKAGKKVAKGGKVPPGQEKAVEARSDHDLTTTTTTTIAKSPIPQPFSPASQPTNTTTTTTIPTPTSTPLTTLQSSLSSKLESAKFRWLNEQLYTQPSGKGEELMNGEGGRAFVDYHTAHRQQTSSWPSPPLPLILSSILTLIPTLPPGPFVIDLGCGDAQLASDLMSSPLGRSSGIKCISLDLVGSTHWVDQASVKVTTVTADQGGKGKDVANPVQGRGWVIPGDFLSSIPLPGRPGGEIPSSSEKTQDPLTPTMSKNQRRKSKGALKSDLPPVGPEVVDIAVCCLSLMGINWVGGIYEVSRVLKTGGMFYVAEVTSRLVDKPGFIDLISSFGFECINHKSPTTHFDLFEFRKTSSYPLGIVKGQEGWLERVKSGEKVMKGCAYKKR